MIRLLRKRPLFALTALVGFVLSGVSDARALDPCPHHDALPSAPESGGSHADHAVALDHGAHSAGLSHGSATVESHDSAQPSEDAANHGPCTCIGQCDAGTAAPMPSAQIALRIDSSTQLVHVPSPESLLTHKSGGLWLLHLPTAPPLSV